MQRLVIIFLIANLFSLGGCNKMQKKVEDFLNPDNPKVVIELNNGDQMFIELFEKEAPKTVENFLNLIEQKFYDNLIFHRIIKNFMIQGGDPLGNGMGGSDEKIPGEFKLNGFNNQVLHQRGVISMARSRDFNSASSQFFICHQDAKHLDGSYAAFGYLFKGLEVLDKIAVVATDSNDKPLEDIIIKSIRQI